MLEHLTSSKVKVKESTDEVLNEFNHYDKDTRILTYKILLDKFNDKYSNFSTNKKAILKEFINSVDNTNKLKEFYNDKINQFKKDLLKLNSKTQNEVTKIKINESIKLIKPVQKNEAPKEEHLINLLQYYELLSEIKKVI